MPEDKEHFKFSVRITYNIDSQQNLESLQWKWKTLSDQAWPIPTPAVWLVAFWAEVQPGVHWQFPCSTKRKASYKQIDWNARVPCIGIIFFSPHYAQTGLFRWRAVWALKASSWRYSCHQETWLHPWPCCSIPETSPWVKAMALLRLQWVRRRETQSRTRSCWISMWPTAREDWERTKTSTRSSSIAIQPSKGLGPAKPSCTPMTAYVCAAVDF